MTIQQSKLAWKIQIGISGFFIAINMFDGRLIGVVISGACFGFGIWMHSKLENI